MKQGSKYRYGEDYATCRACDKDKPRNEFPRKIRTVLLKEGKTLYWVCRDCLRTKRKRWAVKRFRLGLEDYETMAEAQDWCCAICGRRPKKLHIDHDHETDKVRQLLCRQCNTLLGMAKENVLILQKAIDYLDRHDANSKICEDER